MANHGGMPSTLLPPFQDGCHPQGLADEIRAELAVAGLPILPPDHALQTEQVSGVSVEVDEESVWVSWENSPLNDASQCTFRVGAWRPGGRDGSDAHPAMRHYWVVRNALTESLAVILRSLGYGIQVDANEYRPGELLVSARVPGPHWRDPAVPPLAGSAGYFPGMRVRLLARGVPGFRDHRRQLLVSVVSAGAAPAVLRRASQRERRVGRRTCGPHVSRG